MTVASARALPGQVGGGTSPRPQFVASLLRDHPDGFTVAQARAALGTSRRYALPLLAELDSLGVTRCRGDVRVPGRRPAPGGDGCR